MDDKPCGSGGWANGHPPELRGKDIGLYYREKQIQSQNSESDKKIKLNSSVDLPDHVLRQAKIYLSEFETNNDDQSVCPKFAEDFRNLLEMSFDEFIEKSKKSFKNPIENVDVPKSNETLKDISMCQQELDEFRKLYNVRKTLPALKRKDDILKAYNENQVILIVGSTGCGKTTQVPQIILDDFIDRGHGAECSIICTQPRRISAISVAERVAYERYESMGGSVGYKIRLEGCAPRTYGSILFCTTGILLQKMQSNPLIIGVNCIILDEVHERNLETDLLMTLLKKILPHRPDLKLILMSATVSEEIFCEYFNNCFTLHIQGTLFPVQVLYVEDILQETGFNKFENEIHRSNYKAGKRKNPEHVEYGKMIASYLPTLHSYYSYQVVNTLLKYKDTEGCENLNFLEHLIFYICDQKPPGAILVFLPGYERISALAMQLKTPNNCNFKTLATKIQVHALHSAMPTVNQKNIFKPPPVGMRKVILSTILAETAVTIEDVVYVINPGRTKNKGYDVLKNIEALEEHWVSQANTKQRKGRAGRVRPGICYNLFTRMRESMMPVLPTPEILTTKLEAVILNLKLLHITNPYAFFKDFLTIPQELAVTNGITVLKRIEALDENENLTPLGAHLARLPIDPQMGKMILMSALFRCLDPITSAAAGISFKTPFSTPLGWEKQVAKIKLQLSNNSKSDHLLIHHVVEGFRCSKDDSSTAKYCYKNFLSRFTLTQIEQMKNQFAVLLETARFLDTSNCCAEISNINSNNIPLLRAIIVAGLYPNIACLHSSKIRGNKCFAIHKMSTPENPDVKFSISSVNIGQPSFDSKFFVYLQKQRYKCLYLLDSTMVFPMALLIFGDGVKGGKTPENVSYITVANEYFFQCREESLMFILRLRENLQLLLRKKALNPSPIAINSKDEQLIKAIEILLSWDADGYYGEWPSSDE